MSEAHPQPPFTVFFDLVITRRKRFHSILDADDAVVFRSALAGETLDWLREQGETEYRVETGSACYALAARTLLTK